MSHSGFVVIHFCGAPVWQQKIVYLDWGSGVGGYVPEIEAAIQDGVERGYPQSADWVTSKWAISLVWLLHSLTGTSQEFLSKDPVARLVPHPTTTHPIDQQRQLLFG